MGLTVLDGGILSTLQDSGRYGYMASGFTSSGAMDRFSMKIANVLVGNNPDECVIEMTIKGMSFELTTDAIIAVTGANIFPTINGKPIPMYAAVYCNKGDIFTSSFMTNGARTYIAFAYGFYQKPFLNSLSTTMRLKAGGYLGRNLKKGDVLFFNNPKPYILRLDAREVNINEYYLVGDKVRVILGPQDDYFSQYGKNVFFTTPYTVSVDSDRMGIRLEGEAIENVKGADIISDGIAMGAIQVPKNGKPIIMMADRQTTGGYAKIGNVITADLPILAQKRPNDTVCFERTDLENAVNELKMQNRMVERLIRKWIK